MKPTLVGLCIVVPFFYLLSTPYMAVIIVTLLMLVVSYLVGNIALSVYNDSKKEK